MVAEFQLKFNPKSFTLDISPSIVMSPKFPCVQDISKTSGQIAMKLAERFHSPLRVTSVNFLHHVSSALVPSLSKSLLAGSLPGHLLKHIKTS